MSTSHAAQRTAFLAALDAEIVRDPHSVVVVRVDLDRFPRIRETFGGTVSRAVRATLIARLEEFLGPTGALLTYGEDAFAGLLRVGDTSPDNLESLGMQLIRTVSAPITLPNNPPIAVGSNVGIAAGGHFDRTDALRLLTGAELAIQQANAIGSRRAMIYQVASSDDPTRLPTLFADMLTAIDEGHFQPWFQPVVSLPDRRIIGAETLIRWVHPDHGIIQPAEFIPEAEKSGLVRDIDAAVWREACMRSAAISTEHELVLSVNISPADLDFPELISTVESCLSDSGLAPERLVFEVTETALSQDWSRARRRLVALKGLGTRIAVDDFGSGHMFLDRLATGIFDIIKIDRSLVAPLDDADGRARALLTGVTSLARSLGLRVVAEGVETEEQVARIIEAGCDRAQGYLFGRPMPDTDFRALVERS